MKTDIFETTIDFNVGLAEQQAEGQGFFETEEDKLQKIFSANAAIAKNAAKAIDASISELLKGLPLNLFEERVKPEINNLFDALTMLSRVLPIPDSLLNGNENV